MWRMEHPTVVPNLDNADLFEPYYSRADLFEVNLSMASLAGAILRKANLSGADLSGSNLRKANLCSVDFSRANGRRANLRGANLSGADLSEAKLNEADLAASDLTGAKLDWTDLTGALVGLTRFTNVDLSGVIGLETVEHLSPSSIDIDTIYMSEGKIPHSFLRRAGVPEFFIQNIAGLVGTRIEFFSLFISYSTHDQAFAERLHADLQAKGVRCWFAPRKLRGGDWLDEQLEGAIRAYDKLLLIISEASMASNWVQWEISNALTREEKEGRRVLFPIKLCSYDKLDEWKCLGRFPGSDLAPTVRRYFIPDFSNWKDHDSYRIAFDRLLKDLQGKAGPASAQTMLP